MTLPLKSGFHRGRVSCSRCFIVLSAVALVLFNNVHCLDNGHGVGEGRGIVQPNLLTAQAKLNGGPAKERVPLVKAIAALKRSPRSVAVEHQDVELKPRNDEVHALKDKLTTGQEKGFSRLRLDVGTEPTPMPVPLPELGQGLNQDSVGDPSKSAVSELPSTKKDLKDQKAAESQRHDLQGPRQLIGQRGRSSDWMSVDHVEGRIHPPRHYRPQQGFDKAPMPADSGPLRRYKLGLQMGGKVRHTEELQERLPRRIPYVVEKMANKLQNQAYERRSPHYLPVPPPKRVAN